jgi:Sugar phosphate permease
MAISSIWFSYAESLLSACLSRSLLGLAGGLSLLPGLRLVMTWLPPRFFGLAASSLIAFTALATFLAGRPLAGITETFGWRFPFFWLGLGTLMLLLLIWFLVADRPESQGAPEASLQEPPVSLWETTKTIVSNPLFWMLGGIYIGTDLLYLTFSSLWAGPYLIEVQGLNAVTVGAILSATAVGFLVGPPLIALWGDFWGSYPKVLFCAILFNFAFLAFLIWGPVRLPLPALFVLCFLAPLGGWTAGLYMAMSREIFPEKMSTSAMGFLNLMPIMGGAVFQQLMGNLLTYAERSRPELSLHGRYAFAYTPALVWVGICIVLTLLVIRKAGAKQKSGQENGESQAKEQKR